MGAAVLLYMSEGDVGDQPAGRQPVFHRDHKSLFFKRKGKAHPVFQPFTKDAARPYRADVIVGGIRRAVVPDIGNDQLGIQVHFQEAAGHRIRLGIVGIAGPLPAERIGNPDFPAGRVCAQGGAAVGDFHHAAGRLAGLKGRRGRIRFAVYRQ